MPADYSANDISWFSKFAEIFGDADVAQALVSAMRALEALSDKNASAYFPDRVENIEPLKQELARLVKTMFSAKENSDQPNIIPATLASLRKVLIGLTIPTHIMLPNRHQVAMQLEQTQMSSSRLAG